MLNILAILGIVIISPTVLIAGLVSFLIIVGVFCLEILLKEIIEELIDYMSKLFSKKSG